MSTSFHLLVIAFITVCLVVVVINMEVFDGLKPVDPPADGPLVSVLIPARNEALNIAKCAGSLVVQDWPKLEVLVLDDRSEDGTAELARAIGGDRLQVIEGTDLPAGWVGKNWACHQLAQAARGEWLFFTDADTEHAPGTVSAAIALAEETRADLLSAWPRLLTVTLGEKLVIPMINFVGMMAFPHAFILWLQKHPHIAARLPVRMLRMLGAANGQFLLFRRSSYERIGGHEALRDHLVDDVAFGRAVAARIGEGMRLINCESLRFSTTRMYRSLGEVWEGFTKNSRAIFEDRPGSMVLLGVIEAVVFVGPFLSLLNPRAPRELVLVEVGLIYLIRFLLAWRFRTSWLGAILHPFGLILAMAIGLNSWIRSSRGGVTWKGRRYTLNAPAEPEG